MTFVEDAELDKEQLHRFNSLCQSLNSQGVPIGRKHAASSFALFDNPQAFLDMVRPGMALYGIYSDNKFLGTDIMDLRPALSLKARVIYVKKIRQGDNVGYNRAYEAPKDTWIATMPVGHADGLPRVAARGASVRIGSELYPLVGTVSASHCMADLGTAEPRVKIGDVVTVFDWQEGSRPENVSEACGASVYDLTMHLSPLMPRRVI